MKTFFRIIKFLIALIIIALIYLLGTNKTFIYDYYKSDKMIDKGIPLKKFVYFLSDENGTIKLISPISISSLNEAKDNYLNSLTKCYGKYYYDEDNKITIKSYDIEEKNHYSNITIIYEDTNYCSEEYILSDVWIYEYDSLSTFVSGDITENAMIKLVGNIYETKRVENPIETEYKAKVKLTVNLHMQKYDYRLVFEDYSENELKVTKIYDSKEQFAVYKMGNVLEYLNSLEKS